MLALGGVQIVDRLEKQTTQGLEVQWENPKCEEIDLEPHKEPLPLHKGQGGGFPATLSRGWNHEMLDVDGLFT